MLRGWLTVVQSGDDWTEMGEQLRGQWERDSHPLRVPNQFRGRFRTLRSYVADTAAAVDDELEREVELLETLIEHRDPEPDHVLSDRELTRLEQLSELAPTSNSELADAWGLGTGIEVHSYLESELEGYCRRDDNRMLQPTKDAVETNT